MTPSKNIAPGGKTPASVYRDGLLRDTLPFWLKHSPDKAHGGFLTFLDEDGSVLSTDKPAWVAGRFTWLLSRLYNCVERKEEWLLQARRGIEFIRRHCFDEDGRMFFAVTRDGRPLRKRRYLFSELFATMAFAEYAKASGEAGALGEAGDLFRLALRCHRTPGLLEPKVFPGTRDLKSLAMPMILLGVTQVLRPVDRDPLYEEVAAEAVREITGDFLKPEFKALLENVGRDGGFLDEPDGREVNPGHSLEAAWFLLEEARARGGDRALVGTACRIIDWALESGWDREYGGLYYFRDCRGLPCPRYEHDLKLWWPHNEAIYATLLAHHLTGEEKYARWHRLIHDWAYARFPDRKHGEWYGYLHRDGSLSSRLKGNMWKGPFHLPRMQLYCWRLLEGEGPDAA